MIHLVREVRINDSDLRETWKFDHCARRKSESLVGKAGTVLQASPLESSNAEVPQSHCKASKTSMHR